MESSTFEDPTNQFMKKLLFLVFGIIPSLYAQDVTLTQLTQNTFIHTSYLQTNDFGHVPCNGLVVRNGQEALVFDTPTDDQNAQKLIHLVQDSLHCKIVAVIPTHFHNDCLGGLLAFHTAGIPSIAHEKTIELTKENQLIEPQQGFKVSTTLRVGTQQVLVKFFGEGHTRDNVVAYFPSEQVLFGGCLIKELNATKGYLGDANLQAWADTVSKIQVAFPHVKHVVPGHGAAGDPLLLDYTKKLFEK